MKRAWMLLLLGLALATGTARSQGIPAPGPSPELKKLEFMVGKAAGTGKLYIPGQAPTPWSDTADVAWTRDGRYLRNESKMEYVGIATDASTMMTAYDAKQKLYRLWRFSSLTMVPIELSGTFEGEKLVLLSKPDEAGMISRATYEPKSKTEYTFLLELKMGDRFEKLADGVYTLHK
jgi:hypothetical protein